MSAQQIEDSREVGDEADLVVFTVLAIFPDIDLEYEVVECTGRVISDQDMSGQWSSSNVGRLRPLYHPTF